MGASGGGYSDEDEASLMTDINITPLVDVVLVLLIASRPAFVEQLFEGLATGRCSPQIESHDAGFIALQTQFPRLRRRGPRAR